MGSARSIFWLLAGIAATAAFHAMVSLHIGFTDSPDAVSRIFDADPAKIERLDISWGATGTAALVRTPEAWRLVVPCSAAVVQREAEKLADAVCALEPIESFSDAELQRLGRSRA